MGKVEEDRTPNPELTPEQQFPDAQTPGLSESGQMGELSTILHTKAPSRRLVLRGFGLAFLGGAALLVGCREAKARPVASEEDLRQAQAISVNAEKIAREFLNPNLLNKYRLTVKPIDLSLLVWMRSGLAEADSGGYLMPVDVILGDENNGSSHASNYFARLR